MMGDEGRNSIGILKAEANHKALERERETYIRGVAITTHILYLLICEIFISAFLFPHPSLN